jgi:hypothetical protein
VLPAQRRQRREIAVVHRRPLPAQLVEGGHHLACVPHDDRITDQAHAGRPVERPLVVTLFMLTPFVKTTEGRKEANGCQWF